MSTNLILGLILSSLMGFGGYYKKALSKGGVGGAIIVGTAIFGFGGWVWGLILVAFFVSSSALSFFKAKNKTDVAKHFDKGHQRDLGQALANGGVGAIVATLSLIWPGGWGFAAFLGAMATVNADTWATELGVLSNETPRLITNGKPVAPGTSGGITKKGTLAAFGGAFFIGGVAWTLLLIEQALGSPTSYLYPVQFIVIASGAGLAGALIDSFFGATWQAIYYCDTCATETEQKYHHPCGNTPTRPLKGVKYLNNDWVNFISAALGALIAVIIKLLLQILI